MIRVSFRRSFIRYFLDIRVAPGVSDFLIIVLRYGKKKDACAKDTLTA